LSSLGEDRRRVSPPIEFQALGLEAAHFLAQAFGVAVVALGLRFGQLGADEFEALADAVALEREQALLDGLAQRGLVLR
jgi:hypothetical protein